VLDSVLPAVMGMAGFVAGWQLQGRKRPAKQQVSAPEPVPQVVEAGPVTATIAEIMASKPPKRKKRR
jgi:hypothetical protein